MRDITLIIFSLFIISSHALRIPITNVRRNEPMNFHDKRATFGRISKAAAGNGDGQASISTVSDALYMANLTIGGQEFQVQLDSGSSDLWVVADSVPNSKPSNIPYNLTYGTGWASGKVTQASVEFAGFTVPDQAFLLATQANNPISFYGAVGILGLGFTSLSSIDSAVNGTGGSWGRTFLYNVFQTDKSTLNFMSFALERANDSSDPITGEITIGEVVPGFEGVQQMPAVSTWPVVYPNRWNVLLDALFVNGVQQALTSSIANVPSGKLVALLDNGASYAYADPNIVKTMYGGIKGATLDESSGIWTVPCDAEVDVTLIIGGNPYPLHPLDVVDHDVSNPKNCVGTFVGQQVAVGGGEFDWLLGDNILRSVYTLYDFGDFDSKGNLGNPYVKLLSVTNATAASIDFHNIRGGKANVTISASGVDVNGTTVPSTTSTTSVDTQELNSDVTKLLNYMPALLGILGFNSLILLCLAGCAVIYFVRRGKSKKMGSQARGENYHYQRVRSQYDPKDGPGTPLQGTTSIANANNVGTSSTRASVRGSMMPPPQQGSRHGSSTSIHTIGKATSNHHVEDEPFTPPMMESSEDHDPDNEGAGDVSTASIVGPAIPPSRSIPPPPFSGQQPFPGPLPTASPSPPITAPMGHHLYDPNFIGVGPAPAPRQRFISAATTDSLGRPHSLFSVASGPNLSPGMASQRPASTYDIPLGAPRPRFVSEAMSDGRPESTFSTTPLIRRSSGDVLTASTSGRPESTFSAAPLIRRGSSDGLQPPSSNASPNAQQQHFEEADLMTPPRPRFMSDVSQQPRPDSTFSMGSVSPNSAPIRPTSRYMDVSGGRPSSEAH